MATQRHQQLHQQQHHTCPTTPIMDTFSRKERRPSDTGSEDGTTLTCLSTPATLLSDSDSRLISCMDSSDSSLQRSSTTWSNNPSNPNGDSLSSLRRAASQEEAGVTDDQERKRNFEPVQKMTATFVQFSPSIIAEAIIEVDGAEEESRDSDPSNDSKQSLTKYGLNQLGVDNNDSLVTFVTSINALTKEDRTIERQRSASALNESKQQKEAISRIPKRKKKSQLSQGVVSLMPLPPSTTDGAETIRSAPSTHSAPAALAGRRMRTNRLEGGSRQFSLAPNDNMMRGPRVGVPRAPQGINPRRNLPPGGPRLHQQQRRRRPMPTMSAIPASADDDVSARSMPAMGGMRDFSESSSRGGDCQSVRSSGSGRRRRFGRKGPTTRATPPIMTTPKKTAATEPAPKKGFLKKIFSNHQQRDFTDDMLQAIEEERRLKPSEAYAGVDYGVTTTTTTMRQSPRRSPSNRNLGGDDDTSLRSESNGSLRSSSNSLKSMRSGRSMLSSRGSNSSSNAMMNMSAHSSSRRRDPTLGP